MWILVFIHFFFNFSFQDLDIHCSSSKSTCLAIQFCFFFKFPERFWEKLLSSSISSFTKFITFFFYQMHRIKPFVYFLYMIYIVWMSTKHDAIQGVYFMNVYALTKKQINFCKKKKKKNIFLKCFVLSKHLDILRKFNEVGVRSCHKDAV